MLEPRAAIREKQVRTTGAGRVFVRRLGRERDGRVGLFILGILVFVAVFAGWLAPHNPIAQHLGQALLPPGPGHWLGTDEFGRDILSRVLFGSRIALLIGFGTVAVSLAAGVLLGLVAGYYRGALGEVIMRVMDVLLAFPYLLLALMVVAVLGFGLTKAMIAVAVTNVPQFARLVEGMTLAHRERDFVEAARAAGAPNGRILTRHLLSNMWGPIVVQATLSVGASITAAAGLGFLGLGVQPPTPEWGTMLSTGRSYMLSSPWVATFPGLAILITVIGFNLLGNGLRAALGGQAGERVRT